MDNVSSWVHVVGMSGIGFVSIAINPDQARSSHFIEQQAYGIEQKVAVTVRHPGRDVRVNPIDHAEFVTQPVAGREVTSHLPFGVAHVALQINILNVEIIIGRHKMPPSATIGPLHSRTQGFAEPGLPVRPPLT